ncbi:hypothetical protein FPV67DRAFT_1455135 [Lyophyllum atratum]|nr:hypothetical protein FPV67DRAFT_1455135 [Lyophyllum atratum]
MVQELLVCASARTSLEQADSESLLPPLLCHFCSFRLVPPSSTISSCALLGVGNPEASTSVGLWCDDLTPSLNGFSSTSLLLTATLNDLLIMKLSSSPQENTRALPKAAAGSISDIVLNGKAYSALLAAESSGSGVSTNQQAGASNVMQETDTQHHSRPHHTPAMSIADLVLNNVTYGAILTSSAKNLELSSESQPPHTTLPVEGDARTPPNSPTSGQGSQSLMGASTTIMAADSAPTPNLADVTET